MFAPGDIVLYVELISTFPLCIGDPLFSDFSGVNILRLMTVGTKVL